jgi:hypothetical protein
VTFRKPRSDFGKKRGPKCLCHQGICAIHDIVSNEKGELFKVAVVVGQQPKGSEAFCQSSRQLAKDPN